MCATASTTQDALCLEQYEAVRVRVGEAEGGAVAAKLDELPHTIWAVIIRLHAAVSR